MRFLSSSIELTAFLLFGYEVATATRPQDAANAGPGPGNNTPLTGRAIPCEQGKIRTFECQNVELLAYLPKSAIGESSGYDLWGWHDSTTGREFLLIGGAATTAFVEVTDPVNPTYLGTLPAHGGVKSASGPALKVYKHYAFVGYEGADNGIQVFDLTQLRAVTAPPMVFQETAHYSGVTRTHTLALNPETGFAYANGTNTCGGGLHMLDVRTPTRPTFVGCYTNMDVGGAVNPPFPGLGGGPGAIHDTQCTVYRGPDRPYKEREICINSSGTGVVVVDVTDKKQPKTISIVRYPNVAYAHQGWLTEDQQYFFLDDELDEPNLGRTRTIILDLIDLDDPVLLTEYFATTGAIDHNLYIRGRYMYQGNYNAGLRIIDIVDPKHPTEVGYLSNAGDAWGTYPFFKNDVVAVSTSAGLILARLQSVIP